MVTLTHHAAVRSQQRGIPPLIMDLIIKYGCLTRIMGADVYSLDKHSRKTMIKEIGEIAYKRLRDLLDIFVVVADDGHVITTGKRFKRIRS